MARTPSHLYSNAQFRLSDGRMALSSASIGCSARGIGSALARPLRERSARMVDEPAINPWLVLHDFARTRGPSLMQPRARLCPEDLHEQLARQHLSLCFPDVEQPHEAVIAPEVHRSGPTGTLPRRMDVLRKIESQQFWHALIAIDDRVPRNRQLTRPFTVRASGGVADARSFERLPRIYERARVALALHPQPRRRLTDDVQHRTKRVVVKDGLNQYFNQVLAPRAAELIVDKVPRHPGRV